MFPRVRKLNLRGPKIQKFSGGTYPQTPLDGTLCVHDSTPNFNPACYRLAACKLLGWQFT